MKKNLFFIFIFSFFLFCFNVSALSGNLLEQTTLSSSRGFSGLQWDSTGNNLYAFDNCVSGTGDNMTKYYTSSSYVLSSLAISSTFNLTSIFPNISLTANSQTYNPSNISQGWHVKSAYVTRNGLHFYMILDNQGCTWFDTNGIHSQSYVLAHYTLPTAFNITSANFTDYLYYYGGEVGGGFSQIAGTYGSSYIAPQINGLYVSDSGNYATISGIWNNGSNINNQPTFFTWNLTTPYYMAGARNATSFALTVNSNISYPFNFSRITSTQYTSYSNLQVSSDNSFYAMIQRNQHSGTQSSIVGIGVGSVQNGVHQSVVSSSSDYGGVTLASTFSNVYLFTQSGGILYKYQIVNFSTQINEAVNQTQGQQIVGDAVDNVIGLFPASETLNFKQKIGWVAVTMVLTAIIILFASSTIKGQYGHFIFWIIIILEVVEFLFFIGIGYINIGVLLILALIAGGFAYFQLRRH